MIYEEIPYHVKGSFYNSSADLTLSQSVLFYMNPDQFKPRLVNCSVYVSCLVTLSYFPSRTCVVSEVMKWNKF